MTAPAFWVNYRGSVDPQIPLTTTYNYALAYTIVGGSPITLTYTLQGPAQLTRQLFMEVKWTPIIGMVKATVTKGGATIFQSNGAEQGFVDQGQVISSTTGVQL